MRLLGLVAAIPALVLGCAPGADPLIATWNLQTVTCDGERAPLFQGSKIPSDGYQFSVTYNADTTFSAVLTVTGCNPITFSGNYTRSGLDVTENLAQVDCNGGCAVVPVCLRVPGIIPTSGTTSWRASLPRPTALEQTLFQPLDYCPTGTIHEVQIYGNP